MAEQIPFGSDDFAENPEPRCPCVLLLDTSKSMRGPRIAALNEGLQLYRKGLLADSLASQRVEVALVSFGGQVQTVCDFTTVDKLRLATLEADGNTPMGAAISRAIDMVDGRKKTYRANGIQYFRPWIFLITDGAPTDPWEAAAARVKQGEAAKAFAFFAVGVEGAKFDILNRISVRKPTKLHGLRFNTLFEWLSSSQASVSRSKPGEEHKTQFTSPADAGWGGL